MNPNSHEYLDAVVTSASKGYWDASPTMATTIHLLRFSRTEVCAGSTVFPVTHAMSSGTTTLGFQLCKVVGEDTIDRVEE